MALSIPIAQFVKNPPADYVPEAPKHKKEKVTTVKKAPAVDYFWRDMIKTPRFYMMFILFMIVSSVGLMIIGSITRIATGQAGITDTASLAFLVSFMAITSMIGRIAGGFISDKIGQINTLFLIIVIQIVNMVGFAFYNSFSLMLIGIIGTGLCFGALLSVFPALTAEQFGLKNYGANYGIIYLAWGLSGIVAPVLADYIYDTTGNFTVAYFICAMMITSMLVLNFMLQRNINLEMRKA
jgi:MFS family permease